MQCNAYCTASSYQIKELLAYFQEKGNVSTLYRDVVHLPLIRESGAPADIFYFSYGVMLCWGLTPEEERRYLSEIKQFEQQPLEVPEIDRFSFVYGETARISKDEIVLPNHEILTKLAFSYGLAQSAKLSTFELTIQKSFNNTKHIPEDLAKRGRILLSRHEIRCKMGELFNERSSVNLSLDVLDTPEFFWGHPELEHLYAMTDNYLDIESRVEVLNHRLDVVKELFGMLGNELHHQHSNRLEWTIIILIVIEVVVSLARDVFQVI